MKKFLLSIVLALFATSAVADLFAWVDDQGIRRHGETVPKQYAATARNLTAEARKEPDKLAAEEKEKSDFKKLQGENQAKARQKELEERDIEEKTQLYIRMNKALEAAGATREESRRERKTSTLN
jgi:hypothetical protein